MGIMYEQLSAEERGTIMALRNQGSSIRAVAAVLCRAPSTIERALRRNGDARTPRHVLMGRRRLIAGYDAVKAGQRARRLHRKPRTLRKLHGQGMLWKQVRILLFQEWSPEQIAGTLRCVSHETIYTAIYATPRGALRRELTVLLRQGRALQRPRSRGKDRRGKLYEDALSIHVRPPDALDRLVPGHWEGDFIKGSANGSAVGTLVDRHSLFVMLVKMEGGTALSALRGFTNAFAPLTEAERQTLTYDRGKEMALHVQLAANTGLSIYFADPHSPWQRGINENTNGLLRQYRSEVFLQRL